MPTLLFDRPRYPEVAYSDVFIEPSNPTEYHVNNAISEDARLELGTLLERVQALEENARPDDLESQEESLAADRAYRSRLLELAEEHGIGRRQSRDSVNFTQLDGLGNTPIVIANMNQVTGRRQAIAAAEFGGTAALPQDMATEKLSEIVQGMHSIRPNLALPVVVSGNHALHELRRLLGKKDMQSAIVVDAEQKVVGTINLDPIPSGVNEDDTVKEHMRKHVVPTVKIHENLIDAFQLLESTNSSILPVVDDNGVLIGAHTKKSIATRLQFSPHIHPETGGLAVLGTIGAINKDPIDRARLLIDLKIRGIILDTAHFDQGIETYRNIEKVRELIESANADIMLIAGNVVTPKAVRDIYAAGADIAKVGIGPGAMCTTRMETAVGRPQFSAVLECAELGRKKGKHIWADGGIKYPRDVDLALAAGASQVMIGSLFSATHESPPAWEISDASGKRWKPNAGMASRQMATLRSNGFKDKRRQIIEEVFGPRSEGVSNRRMYANPSMLSSVDIAHWIVRGLTSSMTYVGAKNLDEYQRFARIGIQQPSGFLEGRPQE